MILERFQKTQDSQDQRPARALLAYCALAERLGKPGANLLKSLTPFFAEACVDFAGQVFDPQAFSDKMRDHYGIEIPRLAALGLQEQLFADGLLEIIEGYAKTVSVYRYKTIAETQSLRNSSVSSVSEAEVQSVFDQFFSYCKQHSASIELSLQDTATELLDRLLRVDSMRLLSKREASITVKTKATTLQLQPTNSDLLNASATPHALHFDFLTSSFLINLRDEYPEQFELVSNVAFANMAAEAIACFKEPVGEIAALEKLTVFLDTPLLLDVLGINEEYKEYSTELLDLMRKSQCKIAVLDDSIAEAENMISASLNTLRSGIHILTAWGQSAKPNHLASLVGNVAARTQDRLNVHVQGDPELNLHRKSQSTVGDIQADLDSSMQAWKNSDAKQHDQKSIWSLIAMRDSNTISYRICDAEFLMITRNTPLIRIGNRSWKTWLKGLGKFSASNVDRSTPVFLSDKQFAGYLWTRSGGASTEIPVARLLAHCSAAIRPRADVKAKAYNLALEMHGKEEAQDIIALLEDREAGNALMRATLGDPEQLTLERFPFILEKVKLEAGEFAAEAARKEEQAKALLATTSLQDEMNRQRATAESVLQVQMALTAEKQALLLDEQQRKYEVESVAKSLKQELNGKHIQDQKRTHQIRFDAFNEAKRRYKLWKFLIVGIYVTLCYFSAINYLSLSIGMGAFLGTFLAALSFWFVPNLLERPLTTDAFSYLKQRVKYRDPTIEVPSDLPDFERGTWNALSNMTSTMCELK